MTTLHGLGNAVVGHFVISFTSLYLKTVKEKVEGGDLHPIELLKG